MARLLNSKDFRRVLSLEAKKQKAEAEYKEASERLRACEDEVYRRMIGEGIPAAHLYEDGKRITFSCTHRVSYSFVGGAANVAGIEALKGVLGEQVNGIVKETVHPSSLSKLLREMVEAKAEEEGKSLESSDPDTKLAFLPKEIREHVTIFEAQKLSITRK